MFASFAKCRAWRLPTTTLSRKPGTTNVSAATWGAARNKVADTCRPCHSQLHILFSEKQLEREFNTIEKLKADESVRRWIEWKRKRPNLGKELYQ